MKGFRQTVSEVAATFWVGVALMVATSAIAETQLRYNYIPETISPEAQKELQAIYDAKAYARVFPEADDLDGWRETTPEGKRGKWT